MGLHDSPDDPGPRQHAAVIGYKEDSDWYVDGVGWLEAGGTSLIEAMEALQTLVVQRDTEHEREDA